MVTLEDVTPGVEAAPAEVDAPVVTNVTPMAPTASRRAHRPFAR
jgi:hypothetical protein